MEDNFDDFDENTPESLIDFDGFVNFILISKYVQVLEIYDKHNKDTMDEIISQYPFLLDKNTIFYYENFTKIYASYIELGEKEYDEIVPTLMEESDVDKTSMKRLPTKYLQILNSEMKNSLYIFFIKKVKNKQRRNKKSVDDLHKELSKALSEENYEIAAKIRDKINKFKK